jgi:hypothetical protein
MSHNSVSCCLSLGEAVSNLNTPAYSEKKNLPSSNDKRMKESAKIVPDSENQPYPYSTARRPHYWAFHNSIGNSHCNRAKIWASLHLDNPVSSKKKRIRGSSR